MIPEPVTPLERDAGLRRQTAYDLEVTLVGFLAKLFSGVRLDNPTLNLAQASRPDQEPWPLPDPDTVVPFDPAERAQTLMLKQQPRVVRGRVPRTVTGEIALDKLPDVPNVIVQAIRAKVEQPSTIVTVRILFSTYDENPDSQGYQDCLNLIEAAALALTSFGQQGIDKAYPIQLPIEWTLIEPDCFPHFVGEMTTTWELPSARPLPDAELFGIVPAEHIELRGGVSDVYPLPFTDNGAPPTQPPPVEPPPEFVQDVLLGTFRPADVNAQQEYFNFAGVLNDWQVRFAKVNPNNKLPAPLVEDLFYFVVNATATTFQLAATQGGAVIALANSGSGSSNQIWKRG